MINRIADLTEKPVHYFLKREIFFSHRSNVVKKKNEIKACLLYKADLKARRKKTKDIRSCSRYPLAVFAEFGRNNVSCGKCCRFGNSRLVVLHRDMEKILDSYERKEGFYLYTGRGPSAKRMHIGHLIPFIFTRWIQETFDVPLVIQMSDDEKYLSEDLRNCEENITMENIQEQTRENVKDIIALGFDVRKTFIFSNFEYMSLEYYKNVCRVQKRIRASDMKKVFDFKDESNIGKINFPAIQAAPCFSSSFPHIFYGKTDVPCLVLCAIDQDCYFDLTRDAAKKMNLKEPALLHGKFLPSLQGGVQYKMSASKPGSAIYLTDTDAEIERKINGYKPERITKEDRDKGLKKSDIDVIYQCLYFVDNEFESYKEKYDNDEIQSKELKTKLIDILKVKIGQIRRRREQVTDEMVKQFMTPRPLNYNHGPVEFF